MELAMKISKDVRKLWRDCCAKNSSSAPCAVTEPSPQDDADVVDEMRTAYATAVHEQPPEDGWSAARAVARRGMVTLDEVEKAIVGVWVEGGHNNLPDFVAATRAGLTAKSTKQERVTVVGAVVYLDGKEFAVFKGHDSNCPAEKYAAGLRQFLAETK